MREAVEWLQFEAMVTSALRSSGALGARRYAAGQPLTVRTASGWRDADVATVGADGLCHLVTFLEGSSGEPPATLMLHPWNHAPRELPQVAFEALRAWWRRELRAQHGGIADALTGHRLDALQQRPQPRWRRRWRRWRGQQVWSAGCVRQPRASRGQPRCAAALGGTDHAARIGVICSCRLLAWSGCRLQRRSTATFAASQ